MFVHFDRVRVRLALKSAGERPTVSVPFTGLPKYVCESLNYRAQRSSCICPFVRTLIRRPALVLSSSRLWLGATSASYRSCRAIDPSSRSRVCATNENLHRTRLFLPNTAESTNFVVETARILCFEQCSFVLRGFACGWLSNLRGRGERG